jgi:hypothetical protein
MEDKELHLDVFLDHSVFHYNGETKVFQEGRQTYAAQSRYAKVTNVLGHGYLESMYNNCASIDTSGLDNSFKKLLKDLVDGVTSEVGRALVGLAFLQITIKSIVPEQSIRLHKGSTRAGSFSWKEGISMRTIDSNFNTPFLRDKGLLNVNKFGIMMTRSLAENYPYSKLYKAEMRGAFDTWIKIVDELENGEMNYEAALAYMMSLLINKSNRFEELANNAISKLRGYNNYTINSVENLLIYFYTNTRYSARAFEVVIHSFMQAYKENGYTDLELVEMSQMRSANKKHGNVGDIELKDGRRIDEAWDAKYGKSYLYDELGELQDKLEANPGVSVAGFIVNDTLDLKYEVKEKIDEVSITTDTDIKLFTFRDWVSYKLEDVPVSERNTFAKDWLVAVVESFARKRLDIAPIDEPCEGWLTDLINLLS